MIHEIKYSECDVLLLLRDNSLEGSDIAARDRPLNFQIPPTVERNMSFLKATTNPTFAQQTSILFSSQVVFYSCIPDPGVPC